MINFQCDYAEGGHPRILERMVQTNLAQLPGYGKDPLCDSARARIRQACNRPDADVHFFTGGTQTNLTVIASALRAHQGVISADLGHIHGHETGAVEATGHKVLALPTRDGVLTARQVEEVCQEHFDSNIAEHMVQPGMVYLSHPTESGALYSRDPLADLSQVCHKYGLTLFLDGARLAYGLASPGTDVTMEDIARLCDVFSIGGTKCGALFGEAVVITNPALKRDFRYHMKQRGGMLAKGRLLGLQFDVLFEDGLYQELGQRGVECALDIRRAFEERGIPMWGYSLTNQQFVILTEEQLKRLQHSYICDIWAPWEGNRWLARFCTSWATQREHVEALAADIRRL